MKPAGIRTIAILLLLNCLFACRRHSGRPKTMSFYYWRTEYALDSLETATLKNNNIKNLYVRYFDVDWPPTDTAPKPVAPINFRTSPDSCQIIPVIYFRNRVFEKISPAAILLLAGKVFEKVRSIEDRKEIQFDCDWTDRTKENYFNFLKTYRELSGSQLSCTIRLHQIKYPQKTGIPPVDHGVLMYYNMGNIDASTDRSIYDKNIAHRYTPFLRTYPLKLDLALPIFAWGLHIRNGKVIQLLNKMSAPLLEHDTSFVKMSTNWYRAKTATFKSGYYFREGDQVKFESVTKDDLREIVDDINRHTNHRIGNLIFFDLDSQNIALYDKNIFKEILDHTD